MYGAIAAAGKDDVRTLACGFPRLHGRGAWRIRGHEFNRMAQAAERIGYQPQLLRVPLAPTACLGIVDENAAHLLILGRGVLRHALRVGSNCSASLLSQLRPPRVEAIILMLCGVEFSKRRLERRGICRHVRMFHPIPRSGKPHI